MMEINSDLSLDTLLNLWLVFDIELIGVEDNEGGFSVFDKISACDAELLLTLSITLNLFCYIQPNFSTN